jgi:hypothetical protein
VKIKFHPDDRPKLLRWLTHGVELARDLHGPKADHRQAVWCLIVEALETFDRVPDQERRWLSSGTRSGGWNAVGMTAHDLLEIEQLRILSAMSPFEESSKVSPQRDAVERAAGVLNWLRWCSKGDDHRLQKAVVHLAKGQEGLAIIASGVPRGRRASQVSYELRTKAVGLILRGLREDAGIVPSPDKIRFQELY